MKKVDHFLNSYQILLVDFLPIISWILFFIDISQIWHNIFISSLDTASQKNIPEIRDYKLFCYTYLIEFNFPISYLAIAFILTNVF